MGEVTATNPPLSQWVRALALIVFVFLCYGTTLLVAPWISVPRWAWAIPPFNARFMGAIYLSEAAAVLVLLFCNRWSPARVALIAAATFTIIVSVATVYHLDQFLPGRRTPIWFVLYVGYVFLPLLALWVYWRLPPVRPLDVSAGWRSAMSGFGGVMIAYGCAQFFFPTVMSAFWPWPIDAMHGRIYAGVFIGPGVALCMIARDGAREEYWATGAFALTFGLSAVAALAIADASTHRANWSAPGTWFWVGYFLLYAALGAGTLWQTVRPDPTKGAARA